MAFCSAASLSASFSPFSLSVSRRLTPAVRASSVSGGINGSEGDNGVSSNPLGIQGDGVDTIQSHQGVENKLTADSSNVMKLFNNVQQNMLFLNKQRVDAVDELQKVQKEKEVLLARISLLEAEVEAVSSERDVMQRELQAFKLNGEGWGMQGKKAAKDFVVPSPIFSEFLLRVDSMALTGAVNVSQANGLKGLVLKHDTHAANVFSSLRAKGDKELASALLPLLDPKRRLGLHITHICTELDPVAVSGGALGNFVMNLSCALQKRGNLVEVILPKYATMNMHAVQHLKDLQVDFLSFFGGQRHKNKIWTGVVNGIPVTFIESLHPGGFFLRDCLYNYSDDFERFSYFCRAALEYILKSGKKPDILHLHDWQTALVAPMFWELFAGQGLAETRILFTCNNFRDQCFQEPSKLRLCDLDPNRLHREDRLQDNLRPNLVNILKGGFVYSNKATLASPRAIASLEHAHGLQSTLEAHKNKIVSISNGLDVALWDPATDPNLPTAFSLENLSGKSACRKFLKQRLGFLKPDDSAPLVGCLAPQVSESELELIKAALDCAVMKGSQFVFIGESKLSHVQNAIKQWQIDVEEKGGKVLPKYVDTVAHQIMAASDILFCSSGNEAMADMPLIAMQYGSVPIAKQQEGYEGSVKDADDVLGRTEANAYVYRSATAHEVMRALIRAVDCKVNDPQRWSQLMSNGMSKDLSWDGQCAEEYMDAYLSITQL